MLVYGKFAKVSVAIAIVSLCCDVIFPKKHNVRKENRQDKFQRVPGGILWKTERKTPTVVIVVPVSCLFVDIK